MNPLPAPQVLFGAGKQAGHVLNLFEWMGLPWQHVLLFDDAHPTQRVGPRGLEICGTIQQGIAHCLHSSVAGMVALGSRQAAPRYSIYRTLVERGVALANLIHPSCHMGPGVRLGSNIVVMPGCVLGPHVGLGSLCCLFSNVTIEHDVQVDDNVVFGPAAVCSGYVRVGRHAFVGAGAICAPDVSIGERALVGAGAVVVADVTPGSVVAGVPARYRRDVVEGDDAPTRAALDAGRAGA